MRTPQGLIEDPPPGGLNRRVLAKCRWGGGGADDRRIAIHLDAGDRGVETLLEAMASLLGRAGGFG